MNEQNCILEYLPCQWDFKTVPNCILKGMLTKLGPWSHHFLKECIVVRNVETTQPQNVFIHMSEAVDFTLIFKQY